MAKQDRIPSLVTGDLEVTWAHLHKPDDAFNALKHSITVLVTDELAAEIESLKESTGMTKVNGLKVDKEGRQVLSVKSTIYTKEGIDVFPCVDANNKETDAVPFGGDVVRLRLAPAVVSSSGPKSLSLYLSGVQIVQKNGDFKSGGNGGGFEVVEGGFDGSAFTRPQPQTKAAPVSEDDIPF